MSQVCFDSGYLLVFLTLVVVVIVWIVYLVREQLNDEIRRLYDNIEDLTTSAGSATSVGTSSRSDVSLRSAIAPSLRSGVPPPQFPMTYGDPRYIYGGSQLVGYVYPHSDPNQMFRLMGRQTGSNKYEYYVIHPYTDIKIPINNKNGWELNDGDRVNIPGFKGHYIVRIYDMDHPLT